MQPDAHRQYHATFTKRGLRYVRAALITALVLIADSGVSARAGQPAIAQEVNRELTGWMIGNFTLTGQDGREITQQILNDKWTFVLFGETECKQACLSGLTALTGMRKRIARTEVVKITQVLFVSTNAQRDTPEALLRYLAPFDSYVTGAIANSENLARLRADLTAADTMPGAGSLWLIGPDRYVRGEFLPPYDVARFTEKFLKIRIGR